MKNFGILSQRKCIGVKIKDFKKDEQSIECQCGCCKLNITLFNWEEDEVGISFSSNYLGKQNSRFKALLNCLKGKEIAYAELLLEKQEAINYFEKVLKMLKEEK